MAQVIRDLRHSSIGRGPDSSTDRNHPALPEVNPGRMNPAPTQMQTHLFLDTQKTGAYIVLCQIRRPAEAGAAMGPSIGES